MKGELKSINGCRDKVNEEEKEEPSGVEIYEANLWKLIKFSLNFSPVHFRPGNFDSPSNGTRPLMIAVNCSN